MPNPFCTPVLPSPCRVITVEAFMYNFLIQSDKIKRFLLFNDNRKAKKPGEQGFDKLYKIRPVLGHIRSKFLEVTPEKHHSIDKQMTPFQGAKQLETISAEKADDMGNKSLHKSWCVSLKLMSLLKIKRFPCIGTLKKARLRGCPLLTDSEMNKRERGTSDYRTDIHSGAIEVKWLDNNTVCLASTYAGITPQDTCRRWNVKDKSRVEMPRPAIVYEFNPHMGGVDLADMLVEICRTHLRTRK
ncbi:hypothetical protein QYM36_015207 [Artemia franciscana]|uniref:PiggyBac transposable element-derived protein domain-containing protein n=1 Tax=Artemia franciscana TaxID=6661 RepID=A0AA88HH93_ARTSF|nr:hypothetical protein QYM36_015207 [Artemia franciscana]